MSNPLKFSKPSKKSMLLALLVLLLFALGSVPVLAYTQGVRVKFENQTPVVYLESFSPVQNLSGETFDLLSQKIAIEQSRSTLIATEKRQIQDLLNSEKDTTATQTDEIKSLKNETEDLKDQNGKLNKDLDYAKKQFDDVSSELAKAQLTAKRNLLLSSLNTPLTPITIPTQNTNNQFTAQRSQNKATASALAKTCVIANRYSSGFYNCAEGMVSVSCSNLGSGALVTASCTGLDLGYYSCSISTLGSQTSVSCS